ncbi:uncharacterized protein LOC130453728 [Monodelphis domestica]|uniref:uncharacterized protein LOC130453728 n=1 Tax=Monodelphis domestica TaxID=13616 RepID=UPI0024E1B1FE|nr:uncharacterized protein LOC130453728 [Monodelphis domestica]
MAHQENHFQTIMDRFSTTTKLFGLTISLSKTEVLFQPAPRRPTNQPCITMDSTQLSDCQHFQVPGQHHRQRRVPRPRDQCQDPKGQPGTRAAALQSPPTQQCKHCDEAQSVQRSGPQLAPVWCETWTLYRKHMKQLEQFHQHSLWSIMRIRWQDRITNQEVLDRANSTSIEVMVLKIQLRWSGHVIRMDPQRIPRHVFYGELSAGLRKQGRPKKRFKDQLKCNLKWAGITPKQLELAASDRSSWRTHIHHAATTFEDERRRRLAAARERRHQATTAPPITTGVPCPMCHKLCASAFGLQSHIRVHQ